MNIQETPAKKAKRKREERIMKLYGELRPLFATAGQTYACVADKIGVSASKVQQLVLASRKEAAL